MQSTFVANACLYDLRSQCALVHLDIMAVREREKEKAALRVFFLWH